MNPCRVFERHALWLFCWTDEENVLTGVGQQTSPGLFWIEKCHPPGLIVPVCHMEFMTIHGMQRVKLTLEPPLASLDPETDNPWIELQPINWC